MRYKHILLDFDGTIVDSSPVVNNIVALLADKYNAGGFGMRDFKHREQLSLKQKLKLYRFMLRIQKEFKLQYGRRLAEIPPFSGMVPLMRAVLDKGCDLAVISSNSAENVRRYFHTHNLIDRLEVYPSRGVFGKHRTIRALAKRKGWSLSDILYVGDELRDVNACEKCGVDIAFVTWGLDGGMDLSGHTIAFIAETPQDLLQFLFPV